MAPARPVALAAALLLLLPAAALGAPVPPLPPEAAAALDALQHDGGGDGDAGDTCATAGPALPVPAATGGLLLPLLDEADYYTLPVPPEVVGVALRVEVAGNAAEVAMAVFGPACSFNLATVASEPAVPGHGGNPGKGHAKCKGQGHLDHPECLVRDVEVGEGYVVFTPLREATFVVLAAYVPPEAPPVPLAGLRLGSAENCHQFCELLNAGAGYDVGVGPSA